jgi:hypothetical protein
VSPFSASGRMTFIDTALPLGARPARASRRPLDRCILRPPVAPAQPERIPLARDPLDAAVRRERLLRDGVQARDQNRAHFRLILQSPVRAARVNTSRMHDLC